LLTQPHFTTIRPLTPGEFVRRGTRRPVASPSGTPTSAAEIFRRPHACRSYTIQPPPGFPGEYSLCAIGDSGALWIEQLTFRPVALHKKGSTSGVETAVASSLDAVLRSLNLNFGVGR